MNTRMTAEEKTRLECEQARRQIEESLDRTRSTMQRQELLKRLWRLEVNENRELPCA